MKEKVLTIVFSVLAVVILGVMVVFGTGIYKGGKNIDADSEKKEIETVYEAQATGDEVSGEGTDASTGDVNTSTEVAKTDDTETLNNELVIKPGDEVEAPAGVVRYDDFTVTLPDEYAKNVIILGGNDGFSLMQKKSYDYDEAMGFMCSFNKADNSIATFAGEKMLKYTPKNMYYINYPTDVPCAFEVEGVMEDYSMLTSFCDEIEASLTIDSDEVYSAQDYVLPMSEFKDVDSNIIEFMDINSLNIALNEIYARHGESYANDPYLNTHFKRCAWYSPSGKKVADEDLNEVETRNVKAINAQIDKYNIDHPYPMGVKLGSTQVVALNDSIGEVAVNYSVSGDANKGYKGRLEIDDDKYTLGDFGIKLNNPVGENYYIVDIDPSDDMREIAIVDETEENSLITYFFAMDQNSIYCMNGIPGCPIPDVAGEGFNGFSEYGMVSSNDMSDLVFKLPIKVNYWLDADTHTLTTNEDLDYVYEIISCPDKYKAVQALSLREAYYDDGMSEMIQIEEGTFVYIVGSNNTNTLEIRTEDGRSGFLTVTEEMKADPSMYFEKVG